MLWLKAFHIIAVICWFAGLFYLPRLFVYHALALEESDSRGVERFKTMERKLYRGIMNPSMIATVVLGAWMLVPNWAAVYAGAGWMHAKLAIVFSLLIYHLACGQMMRTFARDQNARGHVFYRIFNEVPVLMLIAVVILVVVKP